jgi:hypothetical protein
MRYRLRTLLIWLRNNDCLRVQITLVLGCLVVMAATACWITGNETGPSGLKPVAVALFLVGSIAIAEGVWKLDN